MKRTTPTPIQALRLKQQKSRSRPPSLKHLQALRDAYDKTLSAPAKRSGLPRSSSLRSKQRRQYRKEGKAYLLAHPYCQITIALLGLDEADVIKHHGAYRKGTDHQDDRSGYCYHVSRADQLHHRNKTNGIRLLNFDYIMSAAAEPHHWTENNLGVARKLGLLCPINCKPDGTMPDGTKQPTTTELLASRHQNK